MPMKRYRMLHVKRIIQGILVSGLLALGPLALAADRAWVPLPLPASLPVTGEVPVQLLALDCSWPLAQGPVLRARVRTAATVALETVPLGTYVVVIGFGTRAAAAGEADEWRSCRFFFIGISVQGNRRRFGFYFHCAVGKGNKLGASKIPAAAAFVFQGIYIIGAGRKKPETKITAAIKTGNIAWPFFYKCGIVAAAMQHHDECAVGAAGFGKPYIAGEFK